MQDDLILQAENIVELAVVALRPDLRGRSAFLQPEGQAKPLARRLHRALEDEIGARGIARLHRERRLVAEGIADRVGQPLGQRLRLVIAADEADRLHADHRLFRRGRRRHHGHDLAGQADMIYGDRVLDVLQHLGAAVDEADVRQFAADLVIDFRRHADRARARDQFETGGDIDAVAVEIVALDDDVADIDAHAELQGPGERLRVAGGDGALALDGADHGRDRAGELGDNGIARRAEDAAMMLGDDGIHDLPAGPQVVERSGLIRAHQLGELMDVGGENCRQLALNRSHWAAILAASDAAG